MLSQLHVMSRRLLSCSDADPAVFIIPNARSAPAADAITFFQQCALRARPDFDLARDLIHAQYICRLLDGAPLAIELAAVWLKVLSTAQIASELARDVDFLATTHHNVPTRHRSMRAVLEQSWRYLTTDEQRVFRRLSLFEGGFLLDSAQAVTGATLRDLSGLVDKSMLQLDQDGRYRIHALLRQLGIQKLADDAEEYAQLRARHAAYFLSFLAARTTAIVGPDQQAILREFQDDVDNIRTAWLFIVEHGTLSQLRGAMPVFFRFLWLRCRYEEGERLAAQSLAGTNSVLLEDEEQDVRIDLIAYHIQFAAILGADNQVLSELHGALVAAVRFAYRPQQAHCHFVLGQVQIHLGNANSAEASLWSAYHLYHALHDKLGVAETALQLGYTLSILKSKPSLELFEESLALFRELGDRSGMADAMDRVAMLHLYTRSELEIGEQLYRESLDIALAANNQLIIARSTGGLATVTWIREQWDLAIHLLRQHREIMQYLGHDNEVQSSLNMLCGVYADASRYAEAISLLNTYPTMWRTPFTARAHIGCGAYTDVMRYLPHETADKLAADHEIDLSGYLLAWAMLLVSNCKLQRMEGLMTKRFLSAEERKGIALEILIVLPTHASSNSFTRVRARRLLTELHVTPSSDAAVTTATSQPLRSLQDLARDVLSIQLA